MVGETPYISHVKGSTDAGWLFALEKQSISQVYQSYIIKRLPRFERAPLYNILTQSRMYGLGKNKILSNLV